MPQIDLHGVLVDFPFQPYEVQHKYMEKLIQSLQSGQNALLESPTGTGKTLCLLCAALAWQQTQVAHTQAMAMQEHRGAAGEHAGSLSRRLREASGDARRKEVVLEYGDGPRDVSLRLPGGRTYSYVDAASSATASTRPQPAPATPAAPRQDSAGVAAGASIRHPVIVYASRTHSQLSQVVRELKKTVYRPRVAVLGSREQLCVHPTVSATRGSQQNAMCRALTAENECSYKRRLQTALGSGPRSAAQVLAPEDSGAVLDIEDMAQAGRERKVCPFYLARDAALLAQADIVFVPYSYLVDPNARRALQVDWQNAVLIFDEAHNLEDWCTSATSFDLTAGTVAESIREVDLCLRRLAEGGDRGTSLAEDGDGAEATITELKVLKAVLMGIEDSVASLEAPARGAQGGLISREGKFVFELFAKSQLTHESHQLFASKLDAAVDMLTTGSVASARALGANAEAALAQATSREPALAKLAGVLNRLFRGGRDAAVANARLYRVYVHEQQEQGRGRGRDLSVLGPAAARRPGSGRTLSYWCFSAGVAMRDLVSLGVHNAVLTSGTLSPLSSFAQEMLLPFPVTLENPHVVDEAQVFVRALRVGPRGRTLNSSFRHRDSDEYKWELGMAVLQLARTVPDGLLVFFPSYSVMAACEEAWQRKEIWAQLHSAKPIVQEPRGSQAEFQQAKDQFEDLVGRGRGATFLAVCRGKVSEGVDFSDHRARCVVVTGLPFPPARAPNVLLKQQFLDHARREAAPAQRGSMLQGRDWYAQQAARAVNQAIGRVIRHRHDYGAIVLADERFAQPRQRAGLSLWLRPFFRDTDSFEELRRDLGAFYGNARRATERMRANAEGTAAREGVYVGTRGGFTVVGTDAPGAKGPHDGAKPAAARGPHPRPPGAPDPHDATAPAPSAPPSGAYAAREAREREAAGKAGSARPLTLADALAEGPDPGRPAPAAPAPAPRVADGVANGDGGDEDEATAAKRRRLAARLGQALDGGGEAAGGADGGGEGARVVSPQRPAAVARGKSLFERMRASAEERQHAASARERDGRPTRSFAMRRGTAPEGGAAPADGRGSGLAAAAAAGSRKRPAPGAKPATPPASSGGEEGASKLEGARRAMASVRATLRATEFAAFKAVLARMRARRREGGSQRAEDGRAFVEVLVGGAGEARGRQLAQECCGALPPACAQVVEAALASPAGPRPPSGEGRARERGRVAPPAAAQVFLAELKRRGTGEEVGEWRKGMAVLRAAIGSARRRRLAPGEDSSVRGAMEGVRAVLARVEARRGAGERGSNLVSAFAVCLPESARAAYRALVEVRGGGAEEEEEEEGQGRGKGEGAGAAVTAAAGVGSAATSRTLGTHVEEGDVTAALARKGVVAHDLVTGRPLPMSRFARERERLEREEEERQRARELREEMQRSAEADAVRLRAVGLADSDGSDGAEGGGAAVEAGEQQCCVCFRAVTDKNKGSMRVAPCGHVCCAVCWDQWLSRRIECPYCRRRVRVKQLRPVEDGPWRAQAPQGGTKQ